MRVPLIAGNWKMNTTIDEAVELVNAMLPGLEAINGVEKAVCPPFISLQAVKKLLDGSDIRLGAQNLFYQESGAYTGEISPLMLAGLCDYVIVGHSERRQYFKESSDMVNKKIKAALKAGIKPILCVGEKFEENQADMTEMVVGNQLEAALPGVSLSEDFVIAYEPVWAIGSGRAATGEQSNTIIGFIRQTMASLCGATKAQGIRILYGGSVTPANTAEFMRQPEVDGALVGGASLKAADFIGIVKQTSEIRSTHLK